MTKFGYALLTAIIIALGVYVFRPSATASSGDAVRLFAGTKPAEYDLLANGLHQRVSGKTVTIGALTLPLSDEVTVALWSQWSAISLPSSKVVHGVAAASFAAHDYGIDVSTRRLWSTTCDFSWGSANGEGFIADLLTGTVFSVGAEQVRRLDQIAGRLDLGTPLPPGVAITTLEAGTTRVLLHDGAWQALGAPMRPDFRVRAETLMRLLGRLRIANLHGVLPPEATPVAHLRFELDSPMAAQAGLTAIYDLRVLRSAAGGALALNDFPVQIILAEDVTAWQQAIGALAEDRLFNISEALSMNPVEHVVVERGGKPWFSLVSTSAKDLDDFSSRWDVVWDGGREFADPSATQRLIEALNDLTVRDVRVRLALEEDWPEALTITVLGKGGRGLAFLDMRGHEVRNESHVGVATRLDPMLEQLAPDRFLDTMIAGRSPERVMKIQRRFLDRQPPSEEVLTHDSRGGWSRTFPRREPVDAIAVQRIARVIATSRALSARLASSEDRTIANAPAFEIAVRFGPKPVGKANDFTELEDTTTNDLGLAMVKGSAGHWRAVAIGTGTAYDLDDELVEQLRQDVANPLVLPLVPALVRRVQLGAGPVVFGLIRAGDQWQMQQGTTTQPANAVEVRRLLRDLAALTATRRGLGGALDTSELALTVSLELPGFDRESERLLLQIGKPGVAGAAAGEVTMFAESTRPGSLESGRAFTSAASVAIFAADSARFTTAP